MGGILGGGGGKASANSGQTSSVTADIPKWALDAVKGNLSRAESLANSPYVSYDPNSRVAPLAADELAAFDIVRQGGQRYQPNYQQSITGFEDLINRSLSGPSEQDINSRMNPYLDQVLNRLNEQASRLYRTERNNVGNQAASMGAYGGSRMAVQEAEALDSAARQFNDRAAQETYNAFTQALGQYNTDINRAGEGYAQIASVAGQGQQDLLRGAEALRIAGSEDRRVRQGLADANYEEFMRKTTFPYEQVAFLNQIAMPTSTLVRGSTTTGTATTTQKTGGGGLFGKADGGVIPKFKDGGQVAHFAAGGGTLLQAIEAAKVSNPGSVQGTYIPGAPNPTVEREAGLFQKLLGAGLSAYALFGDSDGTPETRGDAVGRTWLERLFTDNVDGDKYKPGTVGPFKPAGYADGGSINKKNTLGEAINMAAVGMPDILQPTTMEAPQVQQKSKSGGLFGKLVQAGIGAGLNTVAPGLGSFTLGVPSSFAFQEGGQVDEPSLFEKAMKYKFPNPLDLIMSEDEKAQKAETFTLPDQLRDAAQKGATWAYENPMDAAGLALLANPIARTGVGAANLILKGGKATAAGAPMLARAVTSLAKSPTAQGLTGMGLLGANYIGSGDLAEQTGDTPAQQAVVEEVVAPAAEQAVIDALGGAPMKSFPGPTISTVEDSVRAEAQKMLAGQPTSGNAFALPTRAEPAKKETFADRVNLPLLMAGIAAMSSEGNAGDAIAQALAAYAGTNTTLEEMEQAKLDKEYERGLTEREFGIKDRAVAVQEMQNKIALMKALQEPKSGGLTAKDQIDVMSDQIKTLLEAAANVRMQDEEEAVKYVEKAEALQAQLNAMLGIQAPASAPSATTPVTQGTLGNMYNKTKNQ